MEQSVRESAQSNNPAPNADPSMMKERESEATLHCMRGILCHCAFVFSGVLVPMAASSLLQDYSGNVDLRNFTTGGGGFQITPGGLVVGSAGDVNNDGHPDIILGLYPRGVCVVFGNGADFPDLNAFELKSGEKGFRMIIPNEDIQTFSAHGVGDVNGDGIDDVAVGFPLMASGFVYVVYGQDNTATTFQDVDLSLLTTSTGIRFVGDPAVSHMGYAVDRAGDINHDGTSDFYMYASGTGSTATAICVIFGRTSFPASVDMATFTSGNDGFKIVDSSPYLRVAGAAGDVNGDGMDDLLVASDTLGIFLIYGSEGPFTDIDINAFTTGARCFQISHFGLTSALSGADFNNDGISDMLIGARMFLGPAPQNDVGTGFVLFGSTAPFGTIDLDAFTSGAGGFKILPATPSDYCGTSMNNAGDVNGDGVDDIIIGCPYADPLHRADAGSAYVLYGQNYTTTLYEDVNLASFNTTSNTTGFVITGSAGEIIGAYVATAGDFNQDGYDDVFVCIGSTSERTYVIRGGNLPLTVSSTSSSSDDSAAALSIGAIVGIVVGSAILLTALAALCYIARKRTKTVHADYGAVSTTSNVGRGVTRAVSVPGRGFEHSVQCVQLVPG